MLSQSGQRKIFAVVILQVFLGLLDLIGIGLVGILGAIAISWVGSHVVIIAHRLSTVREDDLAVYMDKRQKVARGNFNEVRKVVPDFDRQARLMGL